MRLPIPVTYSPMEAKAVAELPNGDAWQYEPKWDGFRALAFRDGDEVDLRSKRGQPFSRYFPEIAEALRGIDAPRFVLDGELVVPVDGVLSFDDLLQRVHPAASRVAKLARETPALFVVFDLLVDESGQSLVDLSLDERRHRLEEFARRYLGRAGRVRLSPATTRSSEVAAWMRALGGGLDGVIAKRRDMPYLPGDRSAVVKYKRRHTADCVVGGFRYSSKGPGIGSLLLGLYDEDGRLHHVGFTSNLPARLSPAEHRELRSRLEALVEPPGFTGRAPGGPSRWSTARSAEWSPLRPELVVEVEYDQFAAERFRHGTRFVRWRPDKSPQACTLAQVESEARSALLLLRREGNATRRTAPNARRRTSGRTTS